MTSRIFKLIRTLSAAAILLAFAPQASAQTYFDFFTALMKGRNASQALSADDLDTAFLIKYVGTQQRGTIDVAANGDITLKHGASGSEVVDTTIECDASIAATGSRNGIIDVSDPACDTVGEVMNIINSQSTNWVMVPLDALLSDDLNAGGSGSLVTVSAQSCSVTDGYAAKWDTDTKFISTIALLPPEARKIGFYLTGTLGTNINLKVNPYAGLKTMVGTANATSTYGSGTSSYAINQELVKYIRTSPNGGVGGSSTSVITKLYGDIAGGATTVNKTFIALTDNFRIVGDDGTKVVLRLTNSAAMASTVHYAYGTVYSTKPNP